MSMQTHIPNVNVQIVFPIPQDNTFVSGSVSLTDENENEIDVYTMDAGDYGMVDYMHTVKAQLNQIGERPLGLRTVVMTLIDDEGLSHTETHRYYLSNPKPLSVGENSLVTYVQALMIVPELSNLQGWYMASDAQHVAAMIEAYNTLSRFPLNRNFTHQRITDYTKEELANVEVTGALADFCRAQLLHANYLLGGEVEKSMRDNGVMSHSVGESTTFFRTSKPLDYGISSRAYQYISRYISRDVVINRA